MNIPSPDFVYKRYPMIGSFKFSSAAIGQTNIAGQWLSLLYIYHSSKT